MKTKLFSILFLAALVLCLPSCKEGCTNQNAINYDPEADKDDGSCQYENDGVVIFWNDQAQFDFLTAQGVITLHFYVNGDEVAQEYGFGFLVNEPDCLSDPSSTTVTLDLGQSQSVDYPYYVTGQDGTLYYSGNVTINSTGCTKVQLGGPSANDCPTWCGQATCVTKDVETWVDGNNIESYSSVVTLSMDTTWLFVTNFDNNGAQLEINIDAAMRETMYDFCYILTPFNGNLGGNNVEIFTISIVNHPTTLVSCIDFHCTVNGVERHIYYSST